LLSGFLQQSAGLVLAPIRVERKTLRLVSYQPPGGHVRARRWIILGAIAAVVIVGVVIAGGLVYRPTVSLVNRTYTAKDLTRILSKVKTASGTSAKLYNEAELLNQSPDNGLSLAIDGFLAKKSVTLIPAKCRTLLASLPMTNPQVAEAPTEIQSQLDLGHTALLAVATVSSAKVPPSAWSHLVMESAAVVRTPCNFMELSGSVPGQFAQAKILIRQIHVKTKAQHTIAFEEVVGVPEEGYTYLDIENVESMEGNLYINATSFTINPTGAPTPKSLINYTNEILKYASELPY
jgi:hypothetical protein